MGKRTSGVAADCDRQSGKLRRNPAGARDSRHHRDWHAASQSFRDWRDRTARELCPDTPILVDAKTVDAGDLEAEMVFGAGARLMTVLSSTSPATHAAVGKVAARFGALVVVDTITESGKLELFPIGAVHSPTDMRVAGDRSTAHIDAVSDIRRRGFRVALAGGLGPETLDAVLEVEPEIVIVGGAITGADDPRRVATWIKDRLRNPGRGW